jgi:[ribosomal protein S18]-alanine N-acetyltransferase
MTEPCGSPEAMHSAGTGPAEALPVHAVWLAAVHAAAFPPRETWSADAIAMQLASPGSFGILDPRGGMVLAREAGGEAEILTLAVAPEVRRQGVARGLLRRAMAEAARRGATVLFLEVSTANPAAHALYIGCGFTGVACRARYYDDGSDALVMRAGVMPATIDRPPPA